MIENTHKYAAEVCKWSLQKKTKDHKNEARNKKNRQITWNQRVPVQAGIFCVFYLECTLKNADEHECL